VLVLSIVTFAGLARGDVSNFRPYALGARAAGMGGAFTAISDDGSGGYYNPGGLAFAPKSSVSLSASIYGVATGSYADALPGEDYSYKDLQVFPVSTAGIYKLGNDPDGGDVFAFSVFVPDAIHNDDRDLLGNLQSSAFFLTHDNQTIWAGAGWARRRGRFGFGVFLYGLVGTSVQQLSISAVDPTNSADFGELTFRFDQSTYGVLGALGMRWDATDHLSLGLSVFSPAVGIGSRRVFGRITSSGTDTSPPEMLVIHADDLHASPTEPLRAQAGVAWKDAAWTLTGDLTFLAGRTVENDLDRTAEGFSQTFRRHAVVDVAVGAEYLAHGHYPLRAGFYTDFTQALSPEEQAAQPVDNTEHLNRYGLTLSAGSVGEHVRTDVGINLAYGTGRDVVPVDLDFTSLRFTDVHELNVYLFLATAYEF
jgi:long-chain fatty acid transport protein